MADFLVASGWQGDALVLEYDPATRMVTAIRVDDPNLVLPAWRVTKSGLVQQTSTGSWRLAIPTNKQFSVDTESAWPSINFGSKTKAG